MGYLKKSAIVAVRPTSMFRIAAMMVAVLTISSQASADQTIKIQTFSTSGAYGTQVDPNLPIYKLHLQNNILVDDSDQPFNSYKPQWTTPDAASQCSIRNLNWKAYYTTYYVVLANDQDHLLAVKACGKSPLLLNSTDQYPAIGQGNFINHAQIAGQSNGVINPVIAAGEMDVVDGKIVYLDTCSGHFQPNVGSFLAFANRLDRSKVLSLTSPLKSIISSGTITDQQIANNLTSMNNSNSPTPVVTRNNRAGTGGCYSYTTVFAVSRQNKTTTLSGGLMALDQGNINIFQTDVNTVTNKNVKNLYLTTNIGIYSYAAWVVTDLHFYNNALDFQFTDETNDTYSLAVHVYSLNHQVDYNSDRPNINKITFQ